jgi:NADH:ubiquinone oxidoreductase subunit 3 (subunit A)
MPLQDVLISPPLTFLIFLACSIGLYWIGGRLAPRFKDVGGKLTAYACGEDMPDNKMKIDYRMFFYIALFFTIMHVAVLVVATVPPGAMALLGVVYLSIIFLSVMALVTRS